MRTLKIFVVAMALVSAACSGSATLGGGDGVRQPEPVPRMVRVEVLAGDDLTPLDASIDLDGSGFRTEADGAFTFEWDEESSAARSVSVAASGFEPTALDITDYPEDGIVELRLDPTVLRGRVATVDGVALPAVQVTLADRTTITDEDGNFSFLRAEAGSIVLTRPAWADASTLYSGDSVEIELTMEPMRVRALRVSGPKAGDADAWAEILELAAGSGVNALVVDVKNERGQVLHDTSVARAHGVGAVAPDYDMAAIVADMDAQDLYKIARIAVFQDSYLANADPTVAAWDRDEAAVWTTNGGEAWLDPTDQDAWGYSLDLAVEACELGFDEIQFDYVSFPFGGPLGSIRFDGFEVEDYYSQEAQQNRTATVNAFLTEARSRLNPLGCAIAVSIFAILLESPSDEGVGHTPETLSPIVDVLSPTIYTHLYESGWAGFEEPNDHAPEIVGIALRAGLERMEGLGILRPWVQRAFLDPDEILAVQAEVEGRDLGWMLWSNAADFNAAMLPPPVE